MADWGKVYFNAKRKHWAVKGTWQGKRCYFSQYQSVIGPVTCETEQMAERLRLAINTDMDKGIFDPARYNKTRPLHLANYADTWLQDIKPDIAIGTWEGYETAVRLYIKPVLGDRFLPDIGHQDLRKLLRELQHLAPKTRRNVFGALHRMLMSAKRDGHVSQLPPWIEFTGSNEVVDPPIKYLSTESQMAIINGIPLQHRAIYLFMMATGCRPSEARALRKIDVSENEIMFSVSFGYRGELKSVKNKRAMPFPIHDELRMILDMAPKLPVPWVFPNPDTGRHYSKEINTVWNRGCDAAGVERFPLYNAVRHSFACQLLNAGVEKALVSRLLRHSDPRMIEKYGKYETATLAGAAGVVRRLA